MVTVYHNPNFLSCSFLEGEELVESVLAQKLSKVADVHTDDLNIAFRQTNTIDDCWWHNSDVVAVVAHARSTSVGDVLEKDGQAFVVAFCGFEPIPEGAAIDV